MTAFAHPSETLRKRLQNYADQSGGLGALNADQALQVFRQVRKVIETDGSATLYPSARFFADWLVHTQLSNPFALELIERLNRVVAEGDPIELIVPHALGLQHLRSELIALFAQYALEDQLLQTGSLWMRFGSLMLQEIAHVPLVFPDDPGKKGKIIEAIDRIRTHWIASYGDPAPGEPIWINRFVIETNSTDDFIWRLDFALPDDTKAGIRGRIYMLDGAPFRINDLNLTTTPTPAALERAAQQLVSDRPQDRIFVQQTGTSQAGEA